MVKQSFDTVSMSSMSLHDKQLLRRHSLKQAFLLPVLLGRDWATWQVPATC